MHGSSTTNGDRECNKDSFRGHLEDKIDREVFTSAECNYWYIVTGFASIERDTDYKKLETGLNRESVEVNWSIKSGN